MLESSWPNSYTCPRSILITYADLKSLLNCNPLTLTALPTYTSLQARHHSQAVYQGLRSIPGGVPAYPLQDAFFARTIGTGVRHRGAAVVTQLTAGSYTVPAIPV